MVLVTFDFKDSSGNEIYRKITISPAISPIAYGTGIVSNDSVVVIDKGSVTTVALAPNVYNVHLSGFNTATEFLISVPSMAEGTTINAKDLLTSVIPSQNYNAATASLALFANTASYALSALSASYAPFPVTSSYALVAISASYAPKQLPDVYDNTMMQSIGIKQSNPQYNLDVNGTIGNSAGPMEIKYKAGSSISIGDKTGTLPQVYLDYTDNYISVFGGNFGIGLDNPQFPLDVNGQIGNSTGDLNFYTATDQIQFNSPDGFLGIGIFGGGAYFDNYQGICLNGNSLANVGIGTISPQYTLHVNGKAGFLNGITTIGTDAQDGDGLVFNQALTSGIFTEGGNVLSMAINVGQVTATNYQSASPGGIFRLDTRGTGTFIVYGNPAGSQPFHNLFSIDFTSGNAILNSGLGNTGIGVSPSYKLDVAGDINFTGTLRKSGSTYVPANATSASYVSGPVFATTAAQMPYSASAHALTPVVATGSAYIQVNASTQFLYVYNGTRWASASLG